MVAAAAMEEYGSVEEAFETIGKSNDVKVYIPQEELVLDYERGKAQMNRMYRKIWGGRMKDGNFEFTV